MKKAASQAGFTLVEVLVSLTLFIIIVVAAVGCLYSVNEASVKVNSMRTVLDNLSFATESLSRTIRTGDNIICGGVGQQVGGPDCPFGTASGGTEIALDSTLGTDESVDYRYVNPTGNAGSIEKCNINGNSETGTVELNTCVSITAPEVNIQKMRFYVDGVAAGDNKQPSVMILIQGVANAGGNNNIAPFALQTYVSPLAGGQ